jgi:tight adherence protein C
MHVDLILSLAAVFTCVALVSGSLASLALSHSAPERKRLRQLGAPGPTFARTEKLQRAEAPNPTLKRLSEMLPTSSKDFSRLRRRLAAVGYDDYGAAVLYSAAQLTLPIVFAAVPVLVLGLRSGWIAGMAAGFVGFLIPDLLLTRKTAQHRKAIQDGLPDALDLIIVCIEAGSSIDQAILRASAELEISLPALARELKTVATETRAGKPRLEAFQDLARRTGVEDVRALVTMLIQTDRFGTSIAQALRTHADTSRTKRRQRAEERASTVGVKLVFPLVLCLIPALYVVCLGPVAVRMCRTLF